MESIRQTCTPRPEVLSGDLQDALFAADFGHVVAGIAPPVYRDPVVFFRNTHPAAALKRIVTAVFERLASPTEPGATLRLSTGFGGGKTHTLIALWHLAGQIAHTSLGAELLPAAGRPSEVVVAGIDAGKAGSDVFGAHDGVQTHSLWGELAYLLGGAEGYRRIQALDDPTRVPDAATIRVLLPPKPVLVLIDELVIYMGHLPEQGQRAILAFINNLMGEIGARTQAVLVVTDPGSQAAYERESRQLGDAVQRAAAVLDDVLGRRVSDYDPIGAGTPEVITRRLFDWISRAAADEASAEYHRAYGRIVAEDPGALPAEAADKAYAREIMRCYPFHPRLLLTAQDRLGALGDFNKSRGTLRLFARILRDVWEKERDLHLITAGDLDWTSERIQSDLLSRLNRERFRAAVDADVVRHAGQLDAEYDTDIHRRVASALLLESLPLTESSALDRRELTLAVLRPSEVGHEPGEALSRLMSVGWHTYSAAGARFQFRYEPNVNRIIEERAATIPYEDAKGRVLTSVQSYFGGHTFRLVSWPSSPHAVSDDAELRLALCDSEELAQRVCDYEDDANEFRIPRRFRNAILAVAPTEGLLREAIATARKVLAAQEVEAEEQRKADGRRTPLRDQLDRVLPGLRLQAQREACRAFNRLVFQGRRTVTLSDKYLVPAEGALGNVSGQARLKDLLDDNDYIYQPGQALDVDLVLEELLPGATPSVEHEGAVLASAVHERALASPHLKLIPNEDPVRNAVLGAVSEGRLVARTADGRAWDGKGCVSGPPGARKREPNAQLYTSLRSDVFLALPDAPCVAGWLAETPPVEDVGKQTLLTLSEAAAHKVAGVADIEEALELGRLDSVIEDGARKVVVNARYNAWQPGDRDTGVPVSTTSWDEALDYAARRPLRSLVLMATQVSAADALLQVAQPFNARSLTLDVLASGELKDGGSVDLAVRGARHSAAIQPLETARRLLRAVGEGATFEARLTLGWEGAPQENTQHAFAQARERAGGRVGLEATFGPEGPAPSTSEGPAHG